MNILIARALSKSFGALQAVNMLDLTVPEGQLRSIIGPNGAGKTTLFNLLSGRIPPSAGKMEFAGKDVTGLPAYELSRLGLARSFQRTNIFLGLTTEENIRLAVQSRTKHNFGWFTKAQSLREINSEADHVLEQIGLIDKRGTIAAALAHGDQRRLDVGVAVATRPRLLLLDEPTAGMSVGETGGMVQLIRQYSGRTTVILIEHDMDIVLTISDHITVMHQGTVIAEGTPSEVQANPKVQEAYLGAP